MTKQRIEKKHIIDQIKKGTATAHRIRREVDLYYYHLREHPLNTVENYADKDIITAITKNYEHILDKYEVKKTTQDRLNMLMMNIYDAIIVEGRNLRVTPELIKMFTKHVSGRRFDDEAIAGQTFVINNAIDFDRRGPAIKPEPKVIEFVDS